jgi:hypothetical protein
MDINESAKVNTPPRQPYGEAADGGGSIFPDLLPWD